MCKGKRDSNKNENYPQLKPEKYKEQFGISTEETPAKKALHKKAFKKAWEIRNFEIDKFWQRSMYFWGFIAVIFAGYLSVVTGDLNGIKAANGMHLDLYLILLGGIFSVAWLLVIKGSKCWQANWEKHIELLEDGITGPLYKTLLYTGNRFYSVSKMNEVLAKVVLVVWVFLLAQYLCDYINNFSNYKSASKCFSLFNEIFFVYLPILAALILCLVLAFCRCFQTSGGEFIVDNYQKDQQDVFFQRD